MKFLQSLSAQVSLFTQGAILALGVVFILLDVITESLNPVIDLAWVTVLVCGLPLLINSVQSIWERLEIHANFLIVRRPMWGSSYRQVSFWSSLLRVSHITL